MNDVIDDKEADRLIAGMLRGESDVDWPTGDEAANTLLIDRIIYHGAAGLLIERNASQLPRAIISRVRHQAVAQAMWEIRHRQILGDLFDLLAEAGIEPIILKGTALAYSLYSNPASRTRGDSDLLIHSNEIEICRRILRELHFHCDQDDGSSQSPARMQELWTFIDSNTGRHDVDLHWQVMNSPRLRHVFGYEECAASKRSLSVLHQEAYGLDHVLALLHACAHRAMSFRSPYIVGKLTYYGGDRLIWAEDIHRLAGSLDEEGWNRLCAAAVDSGLGPVCLSGLRFAQRVRGTPLPSEVDKRLGNINSKLPRESAYLLHAGQAQRAASDLIAVDGLAAKARFLIGRGLPSSAALRSKYPRMASRPLFLLHFRRIIDLFRKRPEKIEQ